MNYPRKNLIHLKQFYTFQSNQMKFENPNSSLPLKRFIIGFLTTLNPRKPNVKQKCISRILLTLTFTTKNFSTYTSQHRVFQNIRKNKDIFITKPDKGNGVVILDQKLYPNGIEEIISDTSKFEKLKKDPDLKREASLKRCLCKLKQKNFFNEIEYDKLYPSGSAPARIYGTPKMHKFSSSDSFPKLRPIVSSIATFNYNLVRFLCDLLSPLVANDYSC